MEHYTLIGHPLGHSMSPWIHERLFALAGREADYTLTDLVAEDLTLQIDDLRAMQGFNITIPHKMEIIPFLDDMAESAQRYQSVNCVVNRRGNLIGYNTDCDGFLRSVESFPLDGKVLLLGCGGVGRMMATEAVLHGADLTIGILERHIPMAKTFFEELRELVPEASVRYALTAELDEPFDLVLNSTPVGMYPKVDAMPLTESLLQQCGAVFDAIYNPTETKLIQTAKAMGKPVCGGAAMLVWQAVKAHEIWNEANLFQRTDSGIDCRNGSRDSTIVFLKEGYEMTLFFMWIYGLRKNRRLENGIGKAAANCPLVDMDDLIVEREGMTIPEIFDQKGEPYFRKVESRLVDELAHTPQIVSCGGGVMTNPLNALIVRQSNGIIVYLQQKICSLL